MGGLPYAALQFCTLQAGVQVADSQRTNMNQTHKHSLIAAKTHWFNHFPTSQDFCNLLSLR